MQHKPRIDFMGNRRWLLLFSAVLLAIAIGSLLINGLNFSIEFQGGTIIRIGQADEISTDRMRSALSEAGLEGAVVQSTADGGFLIRSSESSVAAAQEAFDEVQRQLDIEGVPAEVTTVGPRWGENITSAALMALVVSILAILLYVSVRFEYKMSVTAVMALAHDVIITLGIYSLSRLEVSPNTVAALLAILGYSLYDTVVVFHRVRENSQRIVKQTFMEMANESVNQVLARSINTSVTSLIPVLALLFLGGETLRDFAVALVIGIAAGTYSSIGFASPIYAMWKEREPKYRALAERAARANR